MIPRLPLRKEAALSRGDLTDWEWRMFDPLLPDRGERGPPIKDKRRTVNGILWVLRTGAPWRDMPKRYGNWNSTFVRFTRWCESAWNKDPVFGVIGIQSGPRG
jgi:transposase